MVVTYINPRVKIAPPLTIERLRDLLIYDQISGQFSWRTSRNKCVAGQVAGTCFRGKYITIGIDGRRYRANRLAWFYVNGAWPERDVDHRNREPSLNRITNLREATASQNVANSRLSKSNKSGHKGVSWSKASGKWMAVITVKRKQKYLGIFEDKRDAAIAYNLAAVSYFGEFATINQIGKDNT